MKKNVIKGSIAIAGVAAILTVGGVMAYFTDTDAQVNKFTVGKIDVELNEPEWDEQPDRDGNGVPDGAENLTPNKTITKDPVITNTGINEAYVFATVQVPCENIVTANENGTRNPAALTDLYSYNTNPGWIKMGKVDVKEGGKTAAHKYLYAYASAEACTILEANKATNPIFSQIKTVNAIEGQGLEQMMYEMPIEVYGIQISDLNGGKTSPTEVWKVYANQNSIQETYQ